MQRLRKRLDIFYLVRLDYLPLSLEGGTGLLETETLEKSGIANMAIRDEYIMAHVKYERQVMDKILNYLKTKNHPLHHWFYGHFHQSWHQEIDGVQYNMLDIMELRELR